MPKSKKVKHLAEGKYRIIKISKEAIFEFIYESIIDNQKVYFNLLSDLNFTSHHDINFETGEFITLIGNDSDKLQLPEGVDLQQLMINMKDTADTLYAPNRYVELSLEEIMTIQSKGASKFAKEEV